MMIEMAEAISATETKAKFFHKVLATGSQSVATSCASESASYEALTEGFKSNPEALVRWAVMQRQLVGADIEAMCSGVGCPVWVIAGGADEMIAPVDLEPVAQRIPQAKLTVFPQADHYALFGDEAVQSAILARARSWCDAGGEVAEPRVVQGAVSLGALRSRLSPRAWPANWRPRGRRAPRRTHRSASRLVEQHDLNYLCYEGQGWHVRRR